MNFTNLNKFSFLITVSALFWFVVAPILSALLYGNGGTYYILGSFPVITIFVFYFVGKKLNWLDKEAKTRKVKNTLALLFSLAGNFLTFVALYVLYQSSTHEYFSDEITEGVLLILSNFSAILFQVIALLTFQSIKEKSKENVF